MADAVILTPKNWKSFQHYKDRAPAWIKLHKGLLTDFTFNRLPLASRALAPMLWLLASEYEEGKITASMEEVAFRLHISEEELKSSLSPLIDSGFFFASEKIAGCEKKPIPEKRREENIEKRREENIPAPAKTQACASDDFERFKAAFPKRDGANPWQPAEKKFNALVKTGVDPEEMIRSATELARQESARGNIGTKFIPQAITWLNQQRFQDCAVSGFDAQPTSIDWEPIVRTWTKTGYWSHQAGPDPESPACRCPRDIIEKVSAEGMRQ